MSNGRLWMPFLSLAPVYMQFTRSVIACWVWGKSAFVNSYSKNDDAVNIRYRARSAIIGLGAFSPWLIPAPRPLGACYSQQKCRYIKLCDVLSTGCGKVSRTVKYRFISQNIVAHVDRRMFEQYYWRKKTSVACMHFRKHSTEVDQTLT